MDFPADILVEILVRLPSSSRRRARLVCRHWRDVVNERTTEMQSRAMPLIWDVDRAVAYVVDRGMSSTSTGNYAELWRSATRDHPYNVQLVGTCNGLLCLCDNNVPCGAIMVVNPATGETLHIPPLPCTDLFAGSHHHWNKWHKAYSFAYHPTSGQYKVVHVPCSFRGVCEFGTLHVFTLGDAAWHEVPVGPGGAKCDDLAIGIISVDGSTHWATGTGRSSRIMTLDLDDENAVSCDMMLPSVRAGHDEYHLTEVHGRLGLVTRRYVSPTTEVWVLEKQRWSHRYSFIRWCIPQPHFAYGEYVLTQHCKRIYGHRPAGEQSPGRRLPCDDVVRISHQDEKTLVANMSCCRGLFRTFAHVETTEPLSVYVSKYSMS